MLGLFLGILASQPAIAEIPSKTNVPVAPEEVLFERDIRYRDGHGRWILNVIRPRETASQPRPAIVLVHGGGWTGGDHYRFSRMGFTFAQKGYVVVLPTYRMIADAPFPACLHDVKNAIRWTRANAKKYNVDPDRIGAYGNSAGGTLALTAAMTATEEDLEGDGSFLKFSSELQAVVGSGVVGDMTHSNHSQRAAAVYRNLAGGKVPGTSDAEIKTMMQQASPASYIRRDVPPIMLVHGANDKVVFIDSTDEFVERLRSTGADITYLRFKDAGHGVMGQMGRKTTPAMVAFLQKHLKTKTELKRID